MAFCASDCSILHATLGPPGTPFPSFYSPATGIASPECVADVADVARALAGDQPTVHRYPAPAPSCDTAQLIAQVRERADIFDVTADRLASATGLQANFTEALIQGLPVSIGKPEQEALAQWLVTPTFQL